MLLGYPELAISSVIGCREPEFPIALLSHKSELEFGPRFQGLRPVRKKETNSKKLSDAGNRTPSCRVPWHALKGGNVSRYTTSDLKSYGQSMCNISLELGL